MGGVLLLLFGVYVIWQRRSHDKQSFDYHQVRSDWASRIERMFVPRRKRIRVHHSSDPITLDNSMRTSRFTFDFTRRSRQYRSGSSDSQTPLTLANDTLDSPSYNFQDYPPKRLSDSPPPTTKRSTIRWWWLFGSRPRQVKSEEPNQRWRIDGPEGSNSGHDLSSHGHQYTVALGPLREDAEDEEERVIQIGQNFPTSAASTPMTQHFPEQALAIRGTPTVPERLPPSGARTPVLAVSAPQTNPGTPVSHSTYVNTWFYRS